MRWCGQRPRLWGMLLVAAGFLAATGCSPDAPSAKPASSSQRPAELPVRPGAAPPGAVGLSPAGVTTRVDVPANSTEEEYYQACHAAKLWMDAQPKTGQSLFEPYLAMIQAAPSGTAGSWNARWADLTPARQAAVITAARAAAGDECG
ncbi:lipoprotein LpqV [Mycobacterium sp. E3251]|uniref:lipoprotein LpqV n=1 Tax=Mycobacterium sp. E3251 TaxID=1834144 RepID=UPI001E287827|nr:lipoprotein LpqV [Mycobacterium sp. E3251]